MASQTQILPLTQKPRRPVTAMAMAVAVWRDAALAAHLGFLAVAAMSIGFGYFSLEMARWSAGLLVDTARSMAE
jgi:hypothetical protein